MAEPGPAHVDFYLFIIIYYNIKILKKKNEKFKKKKSKNPLKKIVIFSNIFLPILHNIGLYIYTVKYKPGIKIPVFLRNISKKKKNKQKYILFSCIRPSPKEFSKHVFMF
jgi:hypothetical protein